MSEISHNKIESYESVAKPVRISENGKEVVVPYTWKGKSCNVIITHKDDDVTIEVVPQKLTIKPVKLNPNEISSEQLLGSKIGEILDAYIQDPTRKKIPEKVSQAFNYVKIMNLIGYHNVDVSVYRKTLSFTINTHEYEGHGIASDGFEADVIMSKVGDVIEWEFDRKGKIDRDQKSPSIDDFNGKVLSKIQDELGDTPDQKSKYNNLQLKISDICTIWNMLLE